MSPTPIFGRVAAVIVAMMLVATACAPSEGAGDTGIATLGDTSATDQASNENGTDTVEAPENVEGAFELFDRCMSDAGFDFETADVGSGGLRVDTFGDVDGSGIDPQESSSSVDDFGSVAAERLGIIDLRGGPMVEIAGRTFAVIGILQPLPLNPDIDRSVLIGTVAAEQFLGAEIIPTAIYLRADPDAVEAVRRVLSRTVNPANPNEVEVSRPSDALEARAGSTRTSRTCAWVSEASRCSWAASASPT